MDISIVSTASFYWAFNKIRPAEVVDKIIKFAVDVITPGGGLGEHSWWMRGIRNVQRNTAKIEREFEIRSDLARWDDEFPYMNHEMIVRYAAGMLASSLAVTVYTTLRYPGRRRRY